MVVVRGLVFGGGALMVIATFGSAVRTVILPRGIPAKLGRVVFISMRSLFRLRIGRNASYERRDRVMAAYAPTSLLMLLVVWISLVLVGYTGMFWGVGSRSVRQAFTLSGSAILTLGFERPPDIPATVLAFSEAALGLILLAMLITYLPSIYGAFSRRESAVTALEIRAGSPPSGVEMIERYWVLERIDQLDEVWVRWEDWFVDLEETHLSFPAVVFFRSPQPDHSWVTAAGAVLDAASLSLAAVDIPRNVRAEFCIRAGYLALRRVAVFFGIPYDPDPKRGDPITIGRNEFNQACERLAAAGIPLKPNLDEAWLDFAGWRVNYDTVLVALAGLTIAPYAPWSSDRSLRDWRPPLLRRRTRS
ncbi:MAG TPA: hypothetical protein VEQ37_06615 [Actinomycetota bacterium]|nr:hypothetical protein [Actinomycetota bacterium]